MLRLVQGDVVARQDVVAAKMAALQALNWLAVALNGADGNSCRASQPRLTQRFWFAPWEFPVALLLAKLKGKVRQEPVAGCHCGDAAMVVGTHALLSRGEVQFSQCWPWRLSDRATPLSRQARLALRDKGAAGINLAAPLIHDRPTPIPQTLAMSAPTRSGHLWVLDELPRGANLVNIRIDCRQPPEKVSSG